MSFIRLRNDNRGCADKSKDPRMVMHFITLYFREEEIVDTEAYANLVSAVESGESFDLADILIGKENWSKVGDHCPELTVHNVMITMDGDDTMCLQGMFYTGHVWGDKVVEKGWLESNIAKIFKGDLVLEYGFHSQFNNDFGCYAPTEEIWTQIPFQEPYETACSVHKGHYNCPLTPIMYENLELWKYEYETSPEYRMPDN